MPWEAFLNGVFYHIINIKFIIHYANYRSIAWHIRQNTCNTILSSDKLPHSSTNHYPWFKLTLPFLLDCLAYPIDDHDHHPCQQSGDERIDGGSNPWKQF